MTAHPKTITEKIRAWAAPILSPIIVGVVLASWGTSRETGQRVLTMLIEHHQVMVRLEKIETVQAEHTISIALLKEESKWRRTGQSGEIVISKGAQE